MVGLLYFTGCLQLERITNIGKKEYFKNFDIMNQVSFRDFEKDEVNKSYATVN